MRVLFLTNIPSPYRVDFFNEFGKLVDLTVVFEGRKAADRNKNWKAAKAENFQEVYMGGKQIGNEQFFSPKILKYVKKKWDAIIIGVYATLSSMLAIEYMRIYRIPFFISSDGGFIRKDPLLQKVIKKHFISSASAWISSGKYTNKYLLHYGADMEKCYLYPFTSFRAIDLENAKKRYKAGKQEARQKIGILPEEKVALMVTQIIYRKGIDVLLKAAEQTKNVEYYIAGGSPENWLDFDSSDRHRNVHFVGFKSKSELMEYYQASDVFVFPTREDIWGLVINEALAYGLPVVTTDHCVAGLELVKESVNGHIVPVENDTMLADAVKDAIQKNSDKSWSLKSLEIIKDYTIENMAVAYKEAILAEHKGDEKNEGCGVRTCD